MVPTWGDIRWNLDDLLSAVGVKVVSSPVFLSDHSVLEDLEPAASRIPGGVSDLGQVDNNWTVVVTADGLVGATSFSWLLMHLDRDRSTGRYAADARNTGSSASVTSDICRRNTRHGAVAIWLTDACPGLINTVHPQLLEGSMSRDRRDGGEGASDEGEGLHCGCLV